jgi:sporulation related protein
VRDEYDIVLIDTPPVLPVTDSAIVASQADGVILVYQAGKVGRLVLKRAKVHIENVGGKVWGVVLNDVKTEIAGYAYTHYYTHYYGEETVIDTHKERLQRAAGFFRRLFRRDGRAEARGEPASGAGPTVPSAGAQRGGGMSASPIELGANVLTAPRPAAGRRTLLIILIVVLAGAIIGAVVGWRFSSWLGEAPSPRALLRKKPDAPPPAPASAPAAPISPAPATPPSAREPVPAPEAAAARPAENAGAAESPIGKPSPALPALADRPSVAATPGGLDRPAPAAPSTGPSGVAALEVPPAAAPVRFAVELGPFVMPGEAEGVERQLTQAGYAAVRVRQQTGAAVYAVIVEKIPTIRDAQALVANLRDEGFGEAKVLGESEPLRVRVGTPLPLRGAVQVAESLRTLGHHVRVSAQPGEAPSFVVRHGNFSSAEEAQAKSQELIRLGLANQVVRVK